MILAVTILLVVVLVIILTDTRVPVYIINGKDQPERYARTVKILREISMTNYTRWDACYPKDTGACPPHMNIGALGCTKSHRSLWKYIEEHNTRDPWILVVEDDIALPKGMAPRDVKRVIDGLLTTRGEKDIVYLGYCWGTTCAHAYAVTPDCARILYENTCECDDPIDDQMRTLVERGKIRAVYADEHAKEETSWAEGLIHQVKGSSTINSHE